MLRCSANLQVVHLRECVGKKRRRMVKLPSHNEPARYELRVYNTLTESVCVAADNRTEHREEVYIKQNHRRERAENTDY